MCLLWSCAQTFQSGVSEVGSDSHWTLTVFVAIVVLGCGLYLLSVLVREIVRAMNFARRARVEEVVEKWKERLQVTRVKMAVFPMPTRSPMLSPSTAALGMQTPEARGGRPTTASDVDATTPSR